MGQILKIAAGIIIASLILQIMFYQQVDEKHEEVGANILRVQDLRNKFIVLTNSLYGYYRKNKELPKYISDLSCVDVFNNRQKMDCAAVQSNGVFYVNNKNDWASAEPYVLDGKLYNKCQTSISISIMDDDGYRDCLKLDVASVPAKASPSFDCGTASNDVERLICKSDSLIEIDANLASLYEGLLIKSSGDKKQEIVKNRSDFIELRRKKCNSSKCIESMTTRKISRLNYLGI